MLRRLCHWLILRLAVAANPLTLPLLIYAGYQAGILLTGQPAAAFEFEASLRWFRQSIVDIGLPLLLGSVLLGLFSALASALLLRRGWLFALRLKRRRRRR